MAQKVMVTDVCDFPHPGETEATRNERFGFGTSLYEVDACDAHAKEIDAAKEFLLQHARKVTGGPHPRSTRAPAGVARTRTRPDREQSVEIRRWANEHGHKVSDRGRIPQLVVEEWHAAHPT